MTAVSIAIHRFVVLTLNKLEFGEEQEIFYYSEIQKRFPFFFLSVKIYYKTMR